jgi:hypothetical protein
MTKNTADVGTLAEVMRQVLGASFELTHIPDTYDGIAEVWQNLLQKLLSKTPRLNRKVLAAAAEEAFDMPPNKAGPWARSLVDCVSHCRLKLKSTTSGKKLSPAVLMIVAQLGMNGKGRHKRLWPGGVRSAAAKLSPRKRQRSPSPGRQDHLDPQKIARMYTACLQLSGRAGPVLSVDSPGDMPSQGDEASVLVVSSQSPAVSEADTDTESRCYVDSQQLAMVKVKRNGESESANLVPGPAGFAVANFSDGSTRTSECPNLVLTLPIKRPAAAKAASDILKKPAAASKPRTKKKQAASNTLKSPAAASSTDSMPPSSSYPKYTCKPDDALALRPGGCSRCRNRPGCTPSCWLQRRMPTI